MGSICNINRNIRTWTINKEIGYMKEEYLPKNSDKEMILDIIIGSVDYDYIGCCDMTAWFLESHFLKLQKGEYKLKNINPNSRNPFDIEDENGNIIEKINNLVY